MTETMTSHASTTEDIATDVTMGMSQTSGFSETTIRTTTEDITSILKTEAVSETGNSCEEITIIAVVFGGLFVLSVICLAVFVYLWCKTRKRRPELKRTGTYDDVFKGEDMDALSVQHSRLSYIQETPPDSELTRLGTSMSTFKVKNEVNANDYGSANKSEEDICKTCSIETEAEPVRNHSNNIDSKTKDNENVATDVDGELSENDESAATADDQDHSNSNDTQPSETENDSKLKLEIPSNNNNTALSGTPLSAIAALDAVLAEFDFDFGDVQ